MFLMFLYHLFDLIPNCVFKNVVNIKNEIIFLGSYTKTVTIK